MICYCAFCGTVDAPRRLLSPAVRGAFAPTRPASRPQQVPDLDPHGISQTCHCPQSDVVGAILHLGDLVLCASGPRRHIFLRQLRLLARPLEASTLSSHPRAESNGDILNLGDAPT